MRLVGYLRDEKQAFIFYTFLAKEGIATTYETVTDNKNDKQGVRIWVYEEDDYDVALEWLETFTKDPSDPRFAAATAELPAFTPPRMEGKPATSPSREKLPISLTKKQGVIYPLTYFIILLCSMLFFFSATQQMKMIEQLGRWSLEVGFIPLQKSFMFDYPKSQQTVDELILSFPRKNVERVNELPEEEKALIEQAQKIPTWKGIVNYLLNKKSAGPLFEKIREGQLWRLFTPCLLHGGFLHILFNMIWVWVLYKQLESRISKTQIIGLTIILAVVSNFCQYLISGPYFLGFSGVVCGVVGFIWMRQKIAPWEGYSMPRSTFVFILIFVLAMFALELFSLLLQTFSLTEISANIANTAHIIGGLTGIFLAKLNLFKRHT